MLFFVAGIQNNRKHLQDTVLNIARTDWCEEEGGGRPCCDAAFINVNYSQVYFFMNIFLQCVPQSVFSEN